MEFDEIYKIYAPKILRVCLGYTNDYEAASDLTQETFITVWEHLKDFKGNSNIGTWIYKIATNKCLRQLQKSNTSRKENLPFNLAENETEHNPDDNIAKLYQYISELPEMERIIIGLYMEDVPQEKIAAIIGISHANVRVKFHRIKEKLFKRFNAHG